MGLGSFIKSQFDLPIKFWIIALISFINAVSFTIIIPILYPYAQQFGLNDFQASLLTSCFAAAQFLSTPILGRFSDFWGRKPLLLISLCGTVLANLLASFAPSAAILFVARILDGLTGGNISIATAVITDTTVPSDRTKAFGLFDAAFRLGFVTGPAISYFAQKLPSFLGVSNLAMGFLASSVIALVAVGLTVFLLPETLPKQKSLTFSWEIFRFGKIISSVRRPQLGRAFVLTFLSGFSFTIFAFSFQPFFLHVLHQSSESLAIMFTLIGVMGVLSQIFAVSPLSQQFNLADLLASAIGMRALIFLLLPIFPILLIFQILIGVLGIVNSFTIPLINTIISINSNNTEQGEIQGINSSFLSISNALGPAAAGLLASISYETPFFVTGGLTLLTAWFASSLKSVMNCRQSIDPQP